MGKIGKAGFGLDTILPVLLRSLFEDETNAKEAEKALIEVGPPAVDALVDALRKGDLSMKRRASSVLKSMGSKDRRVLDALIDSLVYEDVVVRMNAAIALRDAGEIAKDAIPALMKALGDDIPWMP